jgi:hypothetical protein
MGSVIAASNFWNPPPTFLGALCLAMAIYFRAFYYFWPQKFSPKLTRRMANWLTAIMVVGALVLIISAAVDQLHAK